MNFPLACSSQVFSVKRRYFSKIAHTSAHNATTILRFTDAPLSYQFFRRILNIGGLCQKKLRQWPLYLKKTTPLNYDSQNDSFEDILPKESNGSFHRLNFSTSKKFTFGHWSYYWAKKKST